jgi:hypothetical protein
MEFAEKPLCAEPAMDSVAERLKMPLAKEELLKVARGEP